MSFTPAKAKPVPAKQAEKFHFAPKRAFGAGTEYPWADWFDGNLYMLKQGEHFPAPLADMPAKVKSQNFVSQLKEQLLKRGQTGNVQLMADEVTVAVQAISSPDLEAAAAYKVHLKDLEKGRKARKAAKLAETNGDNSTGNEESTEA